MKVNVKTFAWYNRTVANYKVKLIKVYAVCLAEHTNNLYFATF